MTDIILDEKALEAAARALKQVLDAPSKGNPYVELAEAAIKAYKANEVDDGWMDISEAPKDGTEILVFAPEQPKGKEVTVVFWKNERWCFCSVNGVDFYLDDKVTHWQPLPNPPKGDKSDE